MSNVTSIDKNKPHTEGPAKCLNCKHEWHAVVVSEYTSGLECPKCSHFKGEFIGEHMPSVRLECKCGCDLFFLLQDDTAMCPNCGDVKDLPL